MRIENEKYLAISLTLRQHAGKPCTWACSLGIKTGPHSFEVVYNMVAGIGPTPEAAFDNAVQMAVDYNHRLAVERQVREADMRRKAEARRFAETFSADDIDLSKLGDLI